MVKYLIKRPVAVTMILIALVTVSILGVRKIPVSLMPDIDVPQITVQANVPGYSAQEMEKDIVAPLRLQLSRIAGIKSISADSRMGMGSILLRFEPGCDVDMYFIEVNEKIDMAMGNLPKEMERPKVIKASALDIPAFYLDISLKNERDGEEASAQFAQLCDFAANVASRRLEQLPSVAMVDMSGLGNSEILCKPDKAKMEALGMTEDDLQAALTASNVQLSSLSVVDGIYCYHVHFDNQVLTVDDVRNVYLNHEGRLLQLKDLCEIEVRTMTRQNINRHEGKNCVSLAVIKQSDAQMGELREAIADVVDDLQKNNPELKFDITRDQTELLAYSINNLEWNLVAAIFFTSLVLVLFMRRWRLALLVALSIPLSLLITLLSFRLIGISLNIISLSGLILGVGMIVDNSIIVIDNILQKRVSAQSVENAVAEGTWNVFTPMLSSVLTTCSVFLPLIFIGGMAGTLFFDQSMGITIALFASLIVSVVVLPVYFYLLVGRRNKDKVGKLTEVPTNSKLHLWIYRHHEKVQHWMFAHLRLCLFLFLMTIPGLMLVFMISERRQMPEIGYSDGIMYVDWNANISVEENDRRIAWLLKPAREQLETNTSMVGKQNFMLFHTREISSSEALVYIKGHSIRDYREVQKEMQARLGEKYPEAMLSFSPSGNLFELIFSSGNPELRLQLQDASGHRPTVEQAMAFVDSLRHHFPAMKIPSVATEENLVLDADVEQMALYGITYRQLYNKLLQLAGGNEVMRINRGAGSIPVVLGTSDADRQQILSSSLKNQEGIEVPLQLLMKERKAYDFKHLYASDAGEFYPVDIEPHGKVREMLDYVSQYNLRNKTVRVTAVGDYFESKQLIINLAWVLGVSVLLLYFILSAQFESLIQPFIILTEIVVDVFVVLSMLYLLGLSIDLMSMTGIIVMAGIVINDSILKVDTINRHRKEGMKLMEAIALAGRERLFPIIMTSLTTIFSLLPFLSRGSIGADLQFPLSLTILIGMVVGTGVSIFFVPILYYSIYKKKAARKL